MLRYTIHSEKGVEKENEVNLCYFSAIERLQSGSKVKIAHFAKNERMKEIISLLEC